MNLVNSLDSRPYLVRQGRKVPVHSPNFNERGWRSSAETLTLANAPMGSVRTSKGDVHVFKGKAVASKVDKLSALRTPVVTDAAIEAAKVVNRSEDVKAAELLGLSTLTVKALRAACKARGLKGYSKAKKADLLAMLT